MTICHFLCTVLCVLGSLHRCFCSWLASRLLHPQIVCRQQLTFSFVSFSDLQARGSLASGHHTDGQHQPQRQHQVRARLAKPGPQHPLLHIRWCPDHRRPVSRGPAPGDHRPIARRQPEQQRQLLRGQWPRWRGPGTASRLQLHDDAPAAFSWGRARGFQRQADETWCLGHIKRKIKRCTWCPHPPSSHPSTLMLLPPTTAASCHYQHTHARAHSSHWLRPTNQRLPFCLEWSGFIKDLGVKMKF